MVWMEAPIVLGREPRWLSSCVPARVQNRTCFTPQLTNCVLESGRNWARNTRRLSPLVWATLWPTCTSIAHQVKILLDTCQPLSITQFPLWLPLLYFIGDNHFRKQKAYFTRYWFPDIDLHSTTHLMDQQHKYTYDCACSGHPVLLELQCKECW